MSYQTSRREQAGSALPSSSLVALGVAFYVYILSLFTGNRGRRRGKEKIIMFEGNIGAGKTTYVKQLAASAPEHYEAAPEVIGREFLTAFYAHPDRYGFALQMTQHAHRAALVRLALLQDSPERRLLLDRSILGDYAFALWNAAIGNLDAEQWSLYLEQAGATVTDALERHVPDAEVASIVFLYDSATRCHERQRARDEKAVDSSYMLGLEAAHFIVMASVPTRYHVVEYRWSEYAERGSDDVEDKKHEMRRESLERRARDAIEHLVFSKRTRDFLEQEFSKNLLALSRAQ